VVEYQREGFAMFQTMLDGIKETAIGLLFHADVQIQEAAPRPATRPGMRVPLAQAPVEIRARGLTPTAPQPSALLYSAPAIDGAAGTGAVTVEREQERGAAPAIGVGRGGPAAPAGVSSGGTARGTDRARPRPRPSGARQAPGQVVGSGPSRNAPCPCGSGKKYKRCHGAPAGAA
jgi:preprotein translocase subunit SecA